MKQQQQLQSFALGRYTYETSYYIYFIVIVKFAIDIYKIRILPRWLLKMSKLT